MPGAAQPILLIQLSCQVRSLGARMNMKIYLSAPLFTQQERVWNRMLARELGRQVAGAEVILPQDFKFGDSYNRPEHFPEIYRVCLDALKESDVVVAVLDGPDVDSGTAFELGYARALGLPVIGIRTDFRESQERGLNVMLAQGCTELLRSMSFSEDLGLLVKDLTGKIASAIRRL